MKKIGLILSSAALLIGAASCTEEVIVQNGSGSSEPVEMTFSATSAEAEPGVNTRSLFREGFQTMWVANDRISVFAGETSNNPFITKDGGIVTDYKGVAPEADEYCVLYPYNSKATLSDRVFTTVLYSEQYAEPNSFASGMNLAVARTTTSSGRDLGFYNSASYLRVLISEDYQGDDIYSMMLEGNNGELIAGDVNISMQSPDLISAVVIDNDNARSAITLTQINTDDHCLKGMYYFFVLAPTNMSSGYKLTLFNKDGATCEITEPANNFEKNHVYTIEIDNAEFQKTEECGHLNGAFNINSVDCAHEFANLVAGGEYDLDCIFTADIDFANDDREWPQVGTREHPYTGKITGNGKTISNFKVSGNRELAGFIGALGVGGEIENLTFDSPFVSSDYEGSVDNYEDDGFVGVVAALLNEKSMNNYTSASIKNCHVINPTVSGGENVGGIVGRSYGYEDAITGCSVSGGTINGQMFVGGIVGNSEGLIDNCHVKNNTKITYNTQSEARVGGIVGSNNTGQLMACTAVAEIQGENSDGLHARYAGGIAGVNNGTMVGCAFSGTVSGDYSGALAGESYGDMYGCYAQNATAAALIYKVKSNTNKEEDVVGPTFKACYWVGTGTIFGSGSFHDYTSENCETVSAIDQVMSTMNNALNEVNNDSEYAYGAGYQYEKNSGDDASIFPVKATKPQ